MKYCETKKKLVNTIGDGLQLFIRAKRCKKNKLYYIVIIIEEKKMALYVRQG